MAGGADTIAAPITASGRAGVAVVRISGRRAAEVADAFTARGALLCRRPRELIYTAIYAEAHQPSALLDWGLAAFFAAPHSFTGEDCLELNLHGSPLLVSSLLEALGRFGVRLAQPGEFSARAFEHGKLDLTQAEAVADLIAAETKAQAAAARSQLSGVLSHAVDSLGEPLRDLVAEMEAHIDFPEEDIDAGSVEEWQRRLRTVSRQLDDYLATYRAGRVHREGADIVLAGVPNAGKSSLLNRIVGEERAIVTPIAGTTRDSIEVRLSLRDLYVRLWDTAGLIDDQQSPREIDPVEREGMVRSRRRVQSADIVVFVLSPEEPLPAQLELYSSLRRENDRMVPAIGKADLLDGARRNALETSLGGGETLFLSSSSGEGIEELLERLHRMLVAGHDTAAVLITTERHYQALTDAKAALESAGEGLSAELPLELIALEVRRALGALSGIVGVTATEDLLGRIFSRFCIGK